MVFFGVPAPDEAFSGLDLPVEDQDRASRATHGVVSIRPDKGSDESDEEGGVPHRHYSHLDSKKAASSSSFLMWVQRHLQKLATGSSSTTTMVVGKDQHSQGRAKFSSKTLL